MRLMKFGRRGARVEVKGDPWSESSRWRQGITLEQNRTSHLEMKKLTLMTAITYLILVQQWFMHLAQQ